MSTLDPEQLASCNLAQNNVIVAGAGSGKTRVLVAIVADLVEEGVEPERIVLSTFTRAAAEEMRSRASEEVGTNLDEMLCGTLHSIAISVLQNQNGQLINVIDDEEALVLLSEIADQLISLRNEEDLPAPNYKSLLEKYNRGRESFGNNIFEGQDRHQFINQLFQSYGDKKEEDGLFDYSDLLIYFNQWLDGREGGVWSRDLEAVLIDEAQDLNQLQTEIVNKLSVSAKKVLIGDPGQCVYSWRGASAEAMVMSSQEEGVKLSLLRRNYRSQPIIVEIANLALPEGPLAQTMTAVRPQEEGRLTIAETNSAAHEAMVIADWIETELSLSSPEKCAILARNHNHLTAIEEELAFRGLPIEKLGFKKDPWVEALTAFMRLSKNQHNRLAWNRLLLAAGGSGDDLSAIITSESPLEVFAEQNSDSYVGEIVNLIQQEQGQSLWRQLCYGPFGAIMTQSGQGAHALEMAEMEWDDEMQAIIKPEIKGSGIAIGTIHASKGLEWSSVAIAHLGPFPLPHAPLAEERRLFYVAVTRSKDNLLLSEAKWSQGKSLVSDQIRAIASSEEQR